jgi:soluble lytic murein transglycosylase
MKVLLRNKPRYRLWGVLAVCVIAGAWLLCSQQEQVRDFFVDDTLFAEEIRETALLHGLPPELVRAVIFRESRFNPDARGTAGEIGLMQILPSGAAAEWARIHKCPVPDRTALENVRVNLEVGCFFLARSMRRWQKYKAQTALALCQYNAGDRRAAKWAPENPEDTDILSRITIRSTKKYVAAILARYERYCKEGEVK